MRNGGNSSMTNAKSVGSRGEVVTDDSAGVNTFTRSETERSQERSTETEVPVIAGYINTPCYYIFTQRVPRIIS